MDPAERSATASAHRPALQRVLGPRPGMMALAAICVLAVVLTLAQLVLSSQDASRSSAEQRFANGAVVRGQLTSALLSTSSAALRAAAIKTAADARPRSTASRRPPRLGYAAILSDDGDVLAASSGTLSGHGPAPRIAPGLRPPGRSRAAHGSPACRPAAAGGAATLDWALPFRSAAGRRVLVEGVPAATLSPFLSAFLDQGSSGRSLYVVDSERRLIAASRSAGLKPGSGLPAPLLRAPRHHVAHDRRPLHGRRRHRRQRLAARAHAAHVRSSTPASPARADGCCGRSSRSWRSSASRA